MSDNEQMNEKEYYKDYLAQTSGNSTQKKLSLVKNTTLILALIALPAGLYYVWEQQESQNKVVINNKIQTKETL